MVSFNFKNFKKMLKLGYYMSPTKLDSSERDLRDHLGAPKWIPASSMIPRIAKATTALAHSGGVASRDSGSILAYGEGGEPTANPGDA